jgi:hypothetical protein
MPPQPLQPVALNTPGAALLTPQQGGSPGAPVGDSVEELRAALQRERAARLSWEREAAAARQQARLLEAALQRGTGQQSSLRRVDAGTPYGTPSTPGAFLRGVAPGPSPVRFGALSPAAGRTPPPSSWYADLK